MAEENTPDETTETVDEGQQPDNVESLRAALAKANKDAERHRLRNKELEPALRESLAKAERELEQLRRSQMSDQEKAIDAAKAEARTAALAEATPRIVGAEFRAAAAGRLTAGQVSSLLEDLDLSKYVTDSGDVDLERIAKRVESFAPAQQQTPQWPDLGQGARTPAPVVDTSPKGLITAGLMAAEEQRK